MCVPQAAVTSRVTGAAALLRFRQLDRGLRSIALMLMSSWGCMMLVLKCDQVMSKSNASAAHSKGA